MVRAARQSGSETLSLKVPVEMAADLQNRARASRRAIATVAVKLLGKALADQRSYEEWKVKAIKLGLADIKAGRTVPHAEVVAMLERARAGRARKKAA